MSALATILPNTQGLKLLRAWLTEDGWVLDEPIPILAIVIDADLNPQFIVPGAGVEELDDTLAIRSAKATSSGPEWTTALVDPAGRITDCFGQVYENPDRYLAALQRRDVRLAGKRDDTPLETA